MNKFIIATESCSDLPIDLVKKYDIAVLPMVLELEGKTYHHYYDHREISLKTFYDKLRDKKTSTTSLVNVGEFIEFFTKLLQKGQDILYVGFSSGLSGTFQSSLIAIDMLKEEYPNQRIVAVDTLSGSLGQGYLVWRTALLREEGKTIDEIAAWLESNKLKVAHLFTVEELGTLKRGGRLSGSAAFFGTLLGVKPILRIDNEGKIAVLRKAIGRKKSLIEMVDMLKEQIVDPENQTVFIAHGDCLEEAKEVGGLIRSNVKIKDIVYSYIGPVIGAHSGPGTIAVFFMADKR